MSSQAKPGLSKAKKILLIVGGVVVFPFLFVVLFAPMIASGLAPGIIEGKVADAIKGKVKVSDVSLSWGGPIKVGSLVLMDEQGQVVATMHAESSLGILSLLGGMKDLGTLTLDGKVDLVSKQTADGRVVSNLQSAIAPKTASAKKDAGDGTLPEIAANLILSKLDVTFKQLDATGAVVTSATINGAKGEAAISTLRTGKSTLDFKLDASVAQGNGGASPVKIAIKSDGFVGADGKLAMDTANMDATVAAAALPSALIDAAVGTGGVLSDAMGDTIRLDASAKGTSTAANVSVDVNAPLANAKGVLKIEGGRLTLVGPMKASLASTAFAEKMPGVRDAMSKSGIALNGWPGVRFEVRSLNLPIPKGTAPADLRGAAIAADIEVDPIAGTLSQAQATLTATTPVAATATQRGGPGGGSAIAKSFTTSLATFSINSTDLAQGVTTKGNVTATLDGAKAGDVQLSATISKLLDGSGVVVKGMPGDMQATFSAVGVNTALVQPFVANSPLRLSEDVGPTADVVLSAKTVDAASGDATVDVDVTSANMTVRAPLSVSRTRVNAREAMVLNIRRVSPALRRVLNNSGAASAPETTGVAGAGTGTGAMAVPRASGNAASRPLIDATGDGAIALTVSTFSVPMKDGSPDMAGLDFAARGTMGAMELNIASTTPGAAVERIGLLNTTFEAVLKPGADPAIKFDSSLTTRAGNALARIDLHMPGMLTGASDTPSAAYIGTRRVVGTIVLDQFPVALASMAGSSVDAKTIAMIQETLGANVSLGITLAAADGVQTIDARVNATNLAATLGATLAATVADLREVKAQLTVDSNSLKGLLRSGGVAETDLASIAMERAARASLNVMPVRIPVRGGSIDWQRANEAALSVTIALDEPLLVRGLPMGERRFNGGFQGLNLTIGAPVVMLGQGRADATGTADSTAKGTTASAASTRRLTGSLKGDLMQIGSTTPVASINGKVDASADLADVTGELSLSKLDTLRADDLLGEPGLVSGALGNQAHVKATVLRTGGADKPMDIAASIDSPRLKISPIKFASAPDRIALKAPVEFTWTIDPAFVQSTLMKPKADAAATKLTVDKPVVVTGTIAAVSISQGEHAGPFKPGIFALDAIMSIPSVTLTREAHPRGAAVTRSTSVLDGISAKIKSDAEGKMVFGVKVTSVTENGVKTDSAMSIDGDIRGYARADGKGDFGNARSNVTIAAPVIPTALVDQLASSGRQMQDVLGPEMSISASVKNFSSAAQPGGPGGAANTAGDGTIEARLVSVKPRTVPVTPQPAPAPASTQPGASPAPGQPASTPAKPAPAQPSKPAAPAPTPPAPSVPAGPPQQALIEISGTVHDGALRVAPAKPLKVELAEFMFNSDTKVLGLMPLFASVQRSGEGAPLSVKSSNLTIPVNGDVSKLNGQLMVSPGKLEYVFKKQLGQFLEQGVFTSPGAMQREIPPFAVNIIAGIATYDKVEIPVRNFTFKTEGRIDLVNNTVDVVTYIPTLAASGSLMSKLNDDLGKGFGKVLPNIISDGTMIPLRARGPMDNPVFSIDMELFIKNFGSQLNPAGVIGNIGKGLEGFLNKPKDKK